MKKEENKGGLKQSAGSETSVAELMKQNSFLTLLPNNRIQCDVTGHELPLDVEQIKAHISASKFKKALEWYKYDYSPFLPYIVPHKSNNKKLFCTLTKQELNKIPKEVEKHVNGKRFLRYNTNPFCFIASWADSALQVEGGARGQSVQEAPKAEARG